MTIRFPGRTLALLPLCLALAGTAAAQEWPPRTTTIINTFNPGTTTDIVARVVAERLQKKFGKPFIVESRPGAGGMIGMAHVARGAADGSIFGISIAGPLVLNRLLYKQMAYDPLKDLTPLTVGAHTPCVLVASKSLEATALPELVELLKNHPGKYNYAYVGNGSLGHLIMEMLAAKSGTKIVPVVYPGAGQAVMSIIAGDVHMGCLPANGVAAQVRAGTLRALAVSTRERAALLPQVPALREFYPDIVGSAWVGFAGPADLPTPLAERMSREIGAVLREPDVVELLRQQMMEPAPDTPAAFRAFMEDEIARWKPVIERNRISAD